MSVVPPAGGSAVGHATTSATDGSYSVSGVAPGTYAVKFKPCASNPNYVYYVTQFYNDEPSLGAADPVTVSAGSTQNGVDAAMQLGGQIAGTVTDSSDAPLGSVCVAASPAGGGGTMSGSIRGATTQAPFSTKTNPAGQYSLDGIPEGQYSMTFVDCGHRGYLQSSTSDVQVAAGSVTEQDATMDLPATISGTVTTAASPQAPLRGICVSAVLADEQVAATTTTAEGSYSMSKLYPGSYQVGFTDCHNPLYLQQYYDNQNVAGSNGVEGTGNFFTVSSGATVGGIDAAMEKGGQFGGKVTNTPLKGQPATGISGICVEAAPVFDPNDPNYNPPYEYATTNSQGGFTVSGLWSWGYDVTFNECYPVNPSYGGTSYRANPMNADIGVRFSLGGNKLPG